MQSYDNHPIYTNTLNCRFCAYQYNYCALIVKTSVCMVMGCSYYNHILNMHGEWDDGHKTDSPRDCPR